MKTSWSLMARKIVVIIGLLGSIYTIVGIPSLREIFYKPHSNYLGNIFPVNHPVNTAKANIIIVDTTQQDQKATNIFTEKIDTSEKNSSGKSQIIENEINYEMVFVDGGKYQQKDVDRQTGKWLSDSISVDNFYIGKTEITQYQWKKLMGGNPSHFKNCDSCPVENVSLFEVQAFIRKLNDKTGREYRLPTKFEWEFAIRGGTKSKGYIYPGSNDINDVSWYCDNSRGKTHPVATKKSNELGIYDMAGNVGEWSSSRSYEIENGEKKYYKLYSVLGESYEKHYLSDKMFYEIGSAYSISYPSHKDKTVGFRLVLKNKTH